jgi:hypothetical protein
MNKPQRPRPDEWRQIIDGQQSGGLAVAAYCLDRGITQGSFYAWKRRLRQPAKRNRSPKIAFVEVTPQRLGTAGTIDICLRGERHLLARRGLDRKLLIELIRTLQSIA